MFAQHFRDHVLPALRIRCRLSGLLVALQVDRFEDAFQDVMHLAIERGALHLPRGTLADLEEWICTELTRQIDTAEPQVGEPAWHRLSYDLATVAAWRRTRAA